MHIAIKCFALLDTFQPEDHERHEVPEGTTLGELIASLGIPREEVNIIFVNSAHAKDDRVLMDGDKVGLFPAVGGG